MQIIERASLRSPTVTLNYPFEYMYNNEDAIPRLTIACSTFPKSTLMASQLQKHPGCSIAVLIR